MFVLVTNNDRSLGLRQNSFFPVLVQSDSHIQHGTRRCKSLQQFSKLSFKEETLKSFSTTGGTAVYDNVDRW